MGKEIQELFEQFLIDNNCYSQFITNLLEQKNKSFEEFINKTLSIDANIEPEEELVNWAFGWTRTEQGYHFWSLLDARWRRIIREY